MDDVLMVELVALTIVLLLEAAGIVLMYEWLGGSAASKILGGITGSALVAWCARSARWALDITCGAFSAYFFGGLLATKLGLPDTRDTWLAVGGVMGLQGSRLIQLAADARVWAWIRARGKGWLSDKLGKSG